MSDKETYDLKEAAGYLHLGVEATLQLFESGQLPGVSLNQKHHCFHHDDLEAFLRETARRQAAERRQGIKPTEHAAAPKRGRKNALPTLQDAA